ncbi:tRNA uridine-5-carboxymethylaminomethyl(34) synthesis enzyme MnmG [Mycoplasma sp. 5370]
MNKYDAIIVGGGHAGIEATYALAKQNFKVLLVTLDKNKLASMPCNPSIGGPAKGIITREIDALGGVQGIFADKAMIQIKMLNESKGPAVRAMRAQIDKDKYSKVILEDIEQRENIDILEDIVEELVLENDSVKGVKTEKGNVYYANAVVLTTGTYMDSRILRGDEIQKSGPDGQRTSNKLSMFLKNNGFELIRLKTGTPPRIWTDSIDFSKIEEEILENNNLHFSFKNEVVLEKQIHCFLTYTTPKTHEIILNNLNKSSMYSGLIDGVGPRYCPSVEDKIVRFKDKERHQIFFEPETAKGDLMYINGLSTSMPIEVQKEMVKSIPGLENARVAKWAYAIEYDAINPLQLKKSLESKNINGLFFGGQINGTSGYEEAAGQGLIAGINASQYLKQEEPIEILRSDGYIGVLIDDLVTKGTNEPYRMLTSRAEYRLLLRNDNADWRMKDYALKANMISKEGYNLVIDKYKQIELKIEELKNTFVSSKSDLAIKYNAINGQSLFQLVSRPDVDYLEILKNFKFAYELVVLARLDGYIQKQVHDAEKMLKLEKLKIPADIDYKKVDNLANEARDKLIKIKPTTIGQASRISGINPADIQMLMFYIKMRNK